VHTFYKRFIQPLSKETDQAEREIVLNYLLVGIFALSAISWIDTLLAPIISGEISHPVRLLGVTANLIIILGLYFIARYKQYHKVVAILLTSLIAFSGCAVAWRWGILNTNSILLLSLAVVMAGILIGARYSIYVTCGLIVVLAYLQHGEKTGRLHPDLHWLNTRPTTGDVIGFSAILFIIALVSWLFNRQMELSLKRARRSEKALQRQRDVLEVKVEKRAKQLEAAQLEKMQEVYRFAELGRLSTALFHDLANHLSSVNVDIEGLSTKDQSGIMRRISQNVGHIDTIVQRVQRQIRGKNSIEIFNVIDEIDEVVKILAPAAEQTRVTVIVNTDKSVKPSLLYKGDITRFRQIILNLVCNAIEAYPGRTRKTDGRTVTVNVSRQRTALAISVTDHGQGIRPGEQTKIFRPFYTTKDKGAGIGLFLVQQIVEHDFAGTISLASDKQTTIFTVILPKSYYAKRSKA
jgi:signal transduction histidine kinase